MSLSKIIQHKKYLRIYSYFSRIILPVIFVFITIIYFAACDKKKPVEQKAAFSFSDSLFVKSEVIKLLGANVKTFFIGDFDEDSSKEIAVLEELTENNNWGIKFALLKADKDKLVKVYESDLLEGSFKESLVKKIKLPQFNYDLIYYDSQDYFWGSGGGEVFAYVVNFGERKTYYAHLFSESRKPVELFLSKNIADKELRNFFVSNFQRDYPNLKLASEDVSLEF